MAGVYSYTIYIMYTCSMFKRLRIYMYIVNYSKCWFADTLDVAVNNLFMNSFIYKLFRMWYASGVEKQGKQPVEVYGEGC